MDSYRANRQFERLLFGGLSEARRPQQPVELSDKDELIATITYYPDKGRVVIHRHDTGEDIEQ